MNTSFLGTDDLLKDSFVSGVRLSLPNLLRNICRLKENEKENQMIFYN